MLRAEGKERAEGGLVGDVRVPSVGRRDGGVEGGMGMGEPLRAGVVEGVEGAPGARPRGCRVAGNRARRARRSRF